MARLRSGSIAGPVDSAGVLRQPWRTRRHSRPRSGPCELAKGVAMRGHGLRNATRRLMLLGLAAALALLASWPLNAAGPAARPEEVGLSAERLQRIGELAKRHVAAGSFSGAVTLVARNGRIAHHEAYGLMDL